MALAIPSCGIKAYMDGELLKHTRENWANKPYRWLDNRNFWLPLMVLLLLVAIIDEFAKHPTGVRLVDVGFWAAVIAYGFMIFCGLMRITPIEWKRYSLKDFIAKYGKSEMLFIPIRHIRTDGNLPEAEFEVAVLDTPRRTLGGPFCLVLFQIFDRLGKKPEVEGGKPVYIFSGDGDLLKFEEEYVPFGSPAKA